MKRRLRISDGGQISIPAPIRRRWGTRTLALADEGDRIVLTPAADDPIAAAEGALAGVVRHVDPPLLRARARANEQAAEARRAAR